MERFTLEQRVMRQEAINATRNLMGRYEFWHVANLHEKCLSLFALDTPGVCIDMDWGSYRGAEGIRRFFLGYHGTHEASKVPPEARAGDIHLHLQTTQVIEVADDLKTTSGISISPGIETGDGHGNLDALWLWNKYSFDCVQENGEWKIWHLRVYNIFVHPYHLSWTEFPQQARTFDLPPDSAPDSYYDGLPPWHYSTEKPSLNVPAPPMPHATYEQGRAAIEQAERESIEWN